jgi:prephenate dehydrogenase
MVRSRCVTTSPPPERIAVLGLGLIGTSVAMAAGRAGIEVTGWDPDARAAEVAARRAGLAPRQDLAAAVADAQLVVVCAPIAGLGAAVAEALEAAPDAVVTDTGSVKEAVVADVRARTAPAALPRFVPGHPMGGSERSGPDHASPSVVDGIVWVVAPAPETDPAATLRVTAFVEAIGARVARLTPERHDRLVAFVSHLPQVASSALMDLAAVEEADEPEILLLAAGGFRDLTRLAASDPDLWAEILVANRERIGAALELYANRLLELRDRIAAADGPFVAETFANAKRARLGLAAKPQVRAGVAVWQVEVPDVPGALASLTLTLGDGGVNIEDLQIVHSPEGGRGTVHLTVAASEAQHAAAVLAAADYDPVRLA